MDNHDSVRNFRKRFNSYKYKGFETCIKIYDTAKIQIFSRKTWEKLQHVRVLSENVAGYFLLKCFYLSDYFTIKKVCLRGERRDLHFFKWFKLALLKLNFNLVERKPLHKCLIVFSVNNLWNWDQCELRRKNRSRKHPNRNRTVFLLKDLILIFLGPDCYILIQKVEILRISLSFFGILNAFAEVSVDKSRLKKTFGSSLLRKSDLTPMHFCIIRCYLY